MCSGCSGDYAGGFEFDDPDDPTANSVDDVSSTSFGAAPDIEARNCAERAARSFELRNDGAENFEILVSATQIVEIRMIPANVQANQLPRRAPESHTPSKHSRGASAKYYQTRQGSETNCWCAVRCLRIPRAVARVCKSGFKEWLKKTRRMIRQSTAQSTGVWSSKEAADQRH